MNKGLEEEEEEERRRGNARLSMEGKKGKMFSQKKRNKEGVVL